MKFGAVNRGQLLFRAGLLGYINTRVHRPAPCEFKKSRWRAEVGEVDVEAAPVGRIRD
jgi:hypothetical protein